VTRWLAFAALLLPLGVGASEAPPPAAAPAEKNSADRYLDGRYRLLAPGRPPDAAEVASACYGAGADAIGELEAGGAIVDPTYDEYEVRRLDCRWAPDDRRIALCRFEQASVPASWGDEARRRQSVARLRERDWKPAAARLAFVAWRNPAMSAGPGWIATDTCRPFVFKGDGWEIDLRKMVGEKRQPE
jgi:hypothetical protein